MILPASFQLAVALRRLPCDFRDLPVMPQIRTALALRLSDPLYGGARELVRLAVLANMEPALARGKGRNAKRRAARIAAEFQAAQDVMADRMAVDGEDAA